ncbi:hypothetical protein Tco_0844344 [Tanacetum coccineum]
MDLKTQLEIVAKNHQASIQNLENKFDKLADKQSGRTSRSYLQANITNPHEVAKVTNQRKTHNKHVMLYYQGVTTDHPIPVGIAENMLVEVGKFTFPVNFVILEMEEAIGTGRKIFNIDSAMKHSYSNDDTCFSINVIDEILEEDFNALQDEGSKILHSIEGTLLKEEFFLEFDEFIAMAKDENSESKSDTEEPPFEKIIINTDYKIKTSLEEPPMNLELKPF